MSDFTTNGTLQTKMTVLDKDGNALVLDGEQALAWAEAQKPYKGVARIRPLRFGAKNAAGGRKVTFAQSKEYKRRHPRSARHANDPKKLRRYEWPSGVSRIGTACWHGWEMPEDSE
jgi:hypothetical protein